MSRRGSRALRLIHCVAILALTNACAAENALEAQKGADISSIAPGIVRSNVERIVGPPNREWATSASVHYCVYQYVGDASPNTSEAALIFGLDLATLGILEFASPQWSQLGASDRRPRRFVAVAYDQGDRVIGVFPDATEFSELPTDGHSSNPTKTGPTVAPMTTSVTPSTAPTPTVPASSHPRIGPV